MTDSPYKTLSSRDKFPCYVNGVECTKRRPGCHDTCPDYARAKAKNDARKAIERQKRNGINDVNRFKVEQAAKSTYTKLVER